jgi:uncharacterized protein (DUF2147 family)
MLMRRRDREPLGMTAGLIAFLAVLLCGLGGRAEAADPRGVWLVDNQVAVELFPCNDGLCGRIVGLSEPRDNAGRPKHDRRNPDPALRQRPLCGLGVLSGLKPVAPGSWEGGTFYNPQDGHRYSASVRMQSDDRLTARFYVGLSLLGESRTLTRIAGSGAPRGLGCSPGEMTAAAGQ